MNRIQVSGIAFCLLLTQGKPIFSESRALISANSNRPNREEQSLVIGAGEKMSSYEGKNRSHILVTEGGSVSGMNLRDSAIASVVGGEVSHLYLYDTSSFSVSGSSDISHLTLEDETYGEILDARVSFLTLKNRSEVRVRSLSGSSEISHLKLHDASSISISGSLEISHLTLKDETYGEIFDARVSFLNLKDRSKVRVRSLDIQGGGSFSATGVEVSGGAVILESDTALHIYGREIDFANGKLSGIWADGTYFEFWLIRRIKDNWFWFFWRAGDDAPEYKIPKSMPNQIIYHQI